MAELVPCRVCGNRPNRHPLTTQEGVEKWRVLHHCQGKLRPSQEEAAAEWNAANAAPAPALLALAKLGARVAREYFRIEGFIRVRGPLLDRDAAWAGVTEDGEHYPVFAPGIADAIAALLAPDQHEGVTDGD